MKKGKQMLSFEINAKHSTKEDVISQETVEKCIEIAVKAHKGQRDKDGNAVILHPLIVGSIGKTDEEKCVGFLHDVVEDTEWTFDDMRHEGVPEKIIEALKLCTHEDSMTYDEYVQRIIDSGNMTAIHVKLNDLRHNFARGKAYNYPRLVAKHEAALKKIENFLENELPGTDTMTHVKKIKLIMKKLIDILKDQGNPENIKCLYGAPPPRKPKPIKKNEG